MDEIDRRSVYEHAMLRMDEHIRRHEDGTLSLDCSSALELGIDPIVFSDLSRSIEETNRKIKSGDIQAFEIK